MSPQFLGGKEQTCLIAYTRGNEALESQFPKLQTFSESGERLSRHRDPNLMHHKRAYAIFCRPEVAGDVISSANAKTMKGYAAVSFKAASISSFRKKIKTSHFRNASTTAGQLELNFRDQGAKMYNMLNKANEALELPFPKQ